MKLLICVKRSLCKNQIEIHILLLYPQKKKKKLIRKKFGAGFSFFNVAYEDEGFVCHDAMPHKLQIYIIIVLIYSLKS